MTNVTPFTPKVKKPSEEIILICADCGCRSFIHHYDGDVECANCDTRIRMCTPEDVAKLVSWRRVVPDVDNPSTLEEATADNLTVKHFNSPEFAKRRVMKRIEEWGDTLITVFAFNKEGEGSHWMGAETAEQRDWCMRKLEAAMEHLKKATYHD